MSEHNKTEALGVGAGMSADTDHKYTFCDEPHPDGVLRCHRRVGHTGAADPAERAHETSWVSGDPCFWGEGAAEAKEAQAAKEELWRVRRALETADFDWSLEAQPGQRPPDTAWSLWIVLGGRGSGLTRTGAEQVRAWSKDPEARIAIVGRTPRDALDGMARMVWTVTPPAVKPLLVTSKSEIRFPSGARGFVLGAGQVTAGPSFTHAWVDDLTLFENAEKVWRDLRLCVRGPLVVTAHPNVEAPGDALLRDLILNQASVVTRVGRLAGVVVGVEPDGVRVRGRGFGQSPKAAEVVRAAAEHAATKMVEELKHLPEPPTYATVEEVREAFGPGSPFDPTGKTNPNAKPVSYPKVLSALEMCISIAEDELAGTDGYSIVAEAEAELAALRAASKAGGGS